MFESTFSHLKKSDKKINNWRSACSSWIFRSNYITSILLFYNKEGYFVNIKLPPTGTMKFLSVDCTTQSNLIFIDYLIELAIFEHWIPYALFNKWKILYFLQILETSSRESNTRGAKQLEVVNTATIFSAPNYPILF